MKITIEHYDKKYSLEQADDTDLNGMLEAFKGMLMCMGYHPRQVDGSISCEMMWFENDDDWNNLDKDNEVIDNHPFFKNVTIQE